MNSQFIEMTSNEIWNFGKIFPVLFTAVLNIFRQNIMI